MYYANRLKTTYQRNMICGMIVAVLLVVMYAAFLYLTREATVIVVVGGGQGGVVSSPGGPPPGMLPEQSRTVAVWNRGPLDPDRLSIIADRSAERIPAVTAISPPSALRPEHALNGVGYGPGGYGGGPDGALPPYDPNFDDYANRPHEPGGFDPSTVSFPNLLDMLIGRKTTVDRPVWIRNLDIATIGRDKSYMLLDDMADTVVVCMTIDHEGDIARLMTAYEHLPELGIADEDKDALSRASIDPARIDGRKVGGEYYVYCIFMKNGITNVKNTAEMTLRLR